MIASLITLLIAALVLVIIYVVVGMFIQGRPLQIIGIILALVLLLYALKLFRVALPVVGAISLTSCAVTVVYEGGKPVMKTQADATNVTFRTGNGTHFHADTINHSIPTIAQGKAAADKIGAIGSAAAATGIIGLLK
jgi:hypothetical protein